MIIFDIIRWLGFLTAWPVHWLLYKEKIYYEDKKSQSSRIKGGALIISNHYSFLDYPLNMFILLPRKLYVVAAELAFNSAIMRFLMNFFGGIKADRINKSMKFIDESVKVIKKGGLVQIYPEAHNTPDGEIHPFKPGYLMIALRSSSPIIPIITDGNYGLFKQTHVMIGKKIYLSEICDTLNPTKEQIQQMNDYVFIKVKELKSKLLAETRKK